MLQNNTLCCTLQCATCLIVSLILPVTQAADELGIPIRNISFGCNYVDREDRSFQVDRLTYHILDMAMRCADEFCQRPRPLLPFEQLVSGHIDLEDFRNRSDWTQWNKKTVIVVCSWIAFAYVFTSALSCVESWWYP